MNVIHISKLQLLPSKYRYHEPYIGPVEVCIRNFEADYPFYSKGCGTVFYCGPRQELWIPMEFDATAEVRDA